MKSYRYLHYDVFTDHLFGGNQLAVFLDARGLTRETMQAIAKEMNFSESTFLLPAERSGEHDTDVRMRIFTPAEELPMAGHPTVGSTFALARSGAIESGRDRWIFGLNIGPTPVSLTWKNGELSFVWMTQKLPSFSDPWSDSLAAAKAIGLSADPIASTGWPVQVVSCGVPFLFIPLATRQDVDRAEANAALIGDLLAATRSGAHGVFLFSAERGADAATVYSRMFAPALGVAEDPATGVASGPLGCYLVRHKIVPAERAGAILSLQGAKMGRPSHVHIAIDLERGEISGVRVGGEAVLAGEGILYI